MSAAPEPTKDEFVKDGDLDYRLQNAVVGTIDSGYVGREGVRETIEKAGKLLENLRVVEEKKLVQRFLTEVNADTGLAMYGIKDILASLKESCSRNDSGQRRCGSNLFEECLQELWKRD